MNKFFLMLIMLPKALWKFLGADVPQLKAILKVKLMLDDRRPKNMGGTTNKKKKPVRFMNLLNIIMSAALGVMYLMPLMMDDAIMGYWLYFTMFLSMLSFMLISDFSTVLFDARDKSILLPRPVNERTLLLSRLLHMFLYLFRIVIPMALPGWIYASVVGGFWVAIWFFVMVLMLSILALFLVNLVYLLILKISSPDRFKDIINYFQIAMSMLVFAFVYLMPRAVGSAGFNQLQHQDFSWAPFTPTYWLAASYSWIHPDKSSAITSWIGILALVAPLMLMWVIVKYLSPSFAQKIGQIDTVTTEESPKTVVSKEPIKQPQKQAFYLKLSSLFNKQNVAKAGFNLAWLQSGRSRNFKMRVLPSFGFVPVYFFYLITMNHTATLNETWQQLPETKTYVLLLYMTSFVVMNLVTMLVNTDQYKAAWVYYSTPIEKPGVLMAGAFKAIWIKYFMPMFLLVSMFVLYVWGAARLVDILLAFTNITVFGLGILRVSMRKLPFSWVEMMNEKKGRFFKSLFIMILPMSFGFAHYWTTATPWLWWMKWIFIGLSTILLWLLWDSYSNSRWEDLKISEQ